MNTQSSNARWKKIICCRSVIFSRRQLWKFHGRCFTKKNGICTSKSCSKGRLVICNSFSRYSLSTASRMNMNSVSALGADAISSCYKIIKQESLPVLCRTASDSAIILAQSWWIPLGNHAKMCLGDFEVLWGNVGSKDQSCEIFLIPNNFLHVNCFLWVMCEELEESVHYLHLRNKLHHVICGYKITVQCLGGITAVTDKHPFSHGWIPWTYPQPSPRRPSQLGYELYILPSAQM